MINRHLDHRREPRPHERIWRNHYVDINLKDEWLEHLNSLKVFKLISICEGHVYVGRLGRSTPHFNLRLKAEIIDKFELSDKELIQKLNIKVTEMCQELEYNASMEFQVRILII